MNKITATATATVDFNIKLTLTVGQAKALDAIVGYGTDAFLKVFYGNLGKSYLQPHESEMRKLFDNIKNNLPYEIEKIESAQETIKEALSNF